MNLEVLNLCSELFEQILKKPLHLKQIVLTGNAIKPTFNKNINWPFSKGFSLCFNLYN